MTKAAHQLIQSFESLPEEDQREVLAELLRFPIEAGYPSAARGLPGAYQSEIATFGSIASSDRNAPGEGVFQTAKERLSEKPESPVHPR